MSQARIPVISGAEPMTGGEAAVRSLITNGIKTVFALPGVQNDWLFNALFDHRDQIRVIHTRHEQGAAFMALGATLATGNIAVCSVVPGPGLLNAGAALATAYALNAKLLFLSGQVPLALIDRKTGALHEINDQLGILRRLTKLALRLEHPDAIPAGLCRAIEVLHSGRPRPVAVEIPMDVLAQRAPVKGSETVAAVGAAPPLDFDELERIAALLSTAVAPMIFVGSGAQDSAPLVRQLAERLGAPVVSYRTGRGVMDSRSPKCFVLPAARALWPRADVVLALGTNLRIPLQSWDPRPDLQIVHIDVDPASHAVLRKPTRSLTARLEDALPPLAEALAQRTGHSAWQLADFVAAQQAWETRVGVLAPQIGYLEAIRAALGEHGVFVDELTQVGFASRLVFPVYHPRTFISTGYMGTLGWGFPTALGVKLARPDVPVVSVTGDGGFMFCIAELATAVQHQIALVVVLFNNNQYGNVAQMQREQYAGRVIATDLVNPDFLALAQAFGARGRRADSPAQLRQELDAAFAASGPTVIEVPVGDMPSVDQFR
jgi:acetolactate synthase-1/2/3 large subunit